MTGLKQDVAWGDDMGYSAHVTADGEGLVTLSLDDRSQSPGDPPTVRMTRNELALLIAVLEHAMVS